MKLISTISNCRTSFTTTTTASRKDREPCSCFSADVPAGSVQEGTLRIRIHNMTLIKSGSLLDVVESQARRGPLVDGDTS